MSFPAMDFEYRICCCHVAVDVAILSTVEIIAILSTYLTGFQYPLMTCQSFNVSLLETYNKPAEISQHKICTTNGPLLFYIIIHLFTALMSLVAISKKNTKMLYGFLFVTSLDLLMSLAYLVVLLVFIVLGEHVDKVLMMFMVGMVIFKIYEILCGRRLYWYLLWCQDNLMTPRSAIIKHEDDIFQF